MMRSSGSRLFNASATRSIGRAEFSNLLARAHEDRQRDRATAIPAPIAVAPGKEIEQPRRILIAGQDVDQIAQVQRNSGAHRLLNDHIAYFGRRRLNSPVGCTVTSVPSALIIPPERVMLRSAIISESRAGVTP